MLELSYIAYAFKGGISIDYLEGAPVWRVRELGKHAEKIAAELKSGQ